MAIDLTTELGQKVAPRFEGEEVVWLTTVGASGTPQPNPVWFTWNGSQFLILSVPNQAKVANIARNARVAVHFNSTEYGDNMAVFTGTAVLDHGGFTLEEEAAYTEKYRSGMASINLTPEGMYATYSQLIRVTPEKLRGH